MKRQNHCIPLFLHTKLPAISHPTHRRSWHDFKFCLPYFCTQEFPGINRCLGQQTFTEATLHWGHPAATCGIVRILHGYQRVTRRCYFSFLLFSACLFQLESHKFLIFFSTCARKNPQQPNACEYLWKSILFSEMFPRKDFISWNYICAKNSSLFCDLSQAVSWLSSHVCKRRYFERKSNYKGKKF